MKVALGIIVLWIALFVLAYVIISEVRKKWDRRQK